MKQLSWDLCLPVFVIILLGNSSPLNGTVSAGVVPADTTFASVTDISVNGSAGRYTFQVEISSPDTGCNQYANWWEIVSEDGNLIYRRILLHSHVDEQPFTRGGGPADISADTNVWIRAHMNNSGYGGQVYFGSVRNGFEALNHPEDFALKLENEEPLPDDCAF